MAKAKLSAPCRAGRRSVRYCRLLRTTLDHNRAVQTAIQWSSGSIVVVYARKKGEPLLVWKSCPYCGESIMPSAAKTGKV